MNKYFNNVGVDNVEVVDKLVDCFLFNDEFEMLKFKIKEIGEYVDYFVIVESTITFSGVKKLLHFDLQKHIFKEYLHKIIHIIVDDTPETDDPWVREHFQRDAISKGLEQLNLKNSDNVVISDCDEIFDIDAVNKFRNQQEYDVMKLEQDLYFYNLENRFPTKFQLSRIAKYYKVKEIGVQMMRVSEFPILNKGGWHFSYFFDINKISKKIKTYAHQEYNSEEYTNLEHIKKCIESGNYLFEDIKLDFIKIEDNDYLPKNYKMLKK